MSTMTDPSFERAFTDRDPVMELLKKMDQDRRNLEQVMGDYVDGTVEADGPEDLRHSQLED
jgi:hypothetical protein